MRFWVVSSGLVRHVGHVPLRLGKLLTVLLDEGLRWDGSQRLRVRVRRLLLHEGLLRLLEAIHARHQPGDLLSSAGARFRAVRSASPVRVA